MITYFHHINYGKQDRINKHWFHHRWFFNTKKNAYNIEIASGPSLRFEFQRGEAGDAQEGSQIIFGFLFFTIYLTFPLPSWMLEQKKCIATWDNNREFYLVQGRKYGFYFYEWAFVWHFHSKVNESSSKDPWWMSIYFHIDEFFLGKKERVQRKWNERENIYFSIDGQEFKINHIKWTSCNWFRTYIPYSIYNRELFYVDIEIKKPPVFSGKGENSWDCGDDGIYGIHRVWNGPKPTYKVIGEITEIATKMYFDSVMESVRRYGGSNKGVKNKFAEYKFIGCKKIKTQESEG